MGDVVASLVDVVEDDDDAATDGGSKTTRDWRIESRPYRNDGATTGRVVVIIGKADRTNTYRNSRKPIHRKMGFFFFFFVRYGTSSAALFPISMWARFIFA
jgi:hypothetical protein